MKEKLAKVQGLFWQQAKFALSGLVATGLDYGLYLLLVYRFMPPAAANITSYTIAVIVNFLMQKRFVFTLQGSVRRAFVLSMVVSGGGLLLSTGIIYGLSQVPFFIARQYLAKLLTTGIVFFYNFFLKRWVFESGRLPA